MDEALSIEELKQQLIRARAEATTYKAYFEMAAKRCRNQRVELRRFNRAFRLASKLVKAEKLRRTQ